MNTPTKTEIQRKIDEICESAARDLAEASKRILENLTPDEIKRFTAGQYPYRLAKTLLCSEICSSTAARFNRVLISAIAGWRSLEWSPGSVWDALQLDLAKEQARACEQRLLAQLAAQDKLDQAAPKLLRACKEARLALDPFELPDLCALLDNTIKEAEEP